MESHYYNSYHISTFEIRGKSDFFYIDNLKFDTDNNPFRYTEDKKMPEFLEFFFIRKNKGVEKFQKELIQDINDFLQITKDIIYLRAMYMLHFLKCCKEVNIKPLMVKLKLKNIKFQKDENWKNQIIYLSNDDINCLITEGNCEKICECITYIYAIFDVKYLINLIRNNENYCPFLLKLLDSPFVDNLDINDFLNDEEITFLQNKLIKYANDKNKISIIIKLSKSLTKSLYFIRENCEQICQINKNYELNLVLPKNSIEDSNQIFMDLTAIINHSEISKKLLNVDTLFSNLVDYFKNKTFEEFCSLTNIELFFKDLTKGNQISKTISPQVLENFHIQVHEKGMSMIRNGQLKDGKIINLISTQDIYYFDPLYKSSEYRDPEVFKYISITDNNNIKLLKDNKIKIWELFANVPNKKI